jgi:hypothetical protein
MMPPNSLSYNPSQGQEALPPFESLYIFMSP